MSVFRLLLVASAVIASIAFDGRNRCHHRELELCAATWNSGVFKLPASELEIDKYCTNAEEVKECIESFLDQCTTPMQHEIIGWATKDPAQLTADFCKKDSTVRNQYLKHAPCLVRAQPEYKICVQDIRAALEKLEEAEFPSRIPTACCTYRRYQKCAADVIESECGKEAIVMGIGLLERNAGVSLKMMCTAFDANSTQCQYLLPTPGTKPSGGATSIVTRLFSVFMS